MEPQLVSWHEQWSEKGLVIIEIDNGAIDTLDEVEAHITKSRIPYTVLHDTQGTVCDRYSVMAYPSAYLLDKTGKVIWEGHPTEDVDAAASRIEKALG
tara:strand:+ start:82 stop:375 length:294 start_codon:yes stop_codon:yes gene_type:complete